MNCEKQQSRGRFVLLQSSKKDVKRYLALLKTTSISLAIYDLTVSPTPVMPTFHSGDRGDIVQETFLWFLNPDGLRNDPIQTNKLNEKKKRKNVE